MPSPTPHYALVVPAKDVKAVKTLLEIRGRLNKTRKIEAYTPDTDSKTGSPAAPEKKYFLVPVLLAASSTPGDAQDDISALLPPDQTYPLIPLHAASRSSASTQTTKIKNPLHAAFSVALSSSLPASLLSPLSLNVTNLVSSLPATYLVYAPLLLLPAHAFAAEPWQTLLAAEAADGKVMQQVWAQVAKEMGVEAVAVNATIPLASSTASSPPPAAQQRREEDESSLWNALRSPTGLTPLYGSFGPRVTSPTPTADDFANALWVSTRQNGIAQVWAPLYTMFSRGNIKEKARLLDLLPKLHSSATTAPPPLAENSKAGPQSVAFPAQQHKHEAFATLDLYAGIGYFAFSHRRAGARPVLCWELNPWSIEGLRRGAAANGWTTTAITSDTVLDHRSLDVDFIVFPHTNAAALSDIASLFLLSLPPIRHVNAGLLPSSRGAWRTAVRAVDVKLGGWLHLHENFGAEEMQERTDEVVKGVRELWEEVRMERMMGADGRGEDCEVVRREYEGEGVKMMHLEKVKTYAPGVWHVVLDVWVPPSE